MVPFVRFELKTMMSVWFSEGIQGKRDTSSTQSDGSRRIGSLYVSVAEFTRLIGINDTNINAKMQRLLAAKGPFRLCY